MCKSKEETLRILNDGPFTKDKRKLFEEYYGISEDDIEILREDYVLEEGETLEEIKVFE